MPQPIFQTITSKTNARVKALRSALQQRRGETVGIEGFHLVREAVMSGLRLQTLFVREDLAGVLRELPDDAADEVLLLSREALESAAATEQAQGVAAVLHRPAMPYEPRTGDLLLIADGLQDPGNLGTLIRSAEAFGAAAVAITAGTVDAWNGKCLRAAAGAAFRLPLVRWDAGLMEAFRTVGGRVFAGVARGGVPVSDAELSGTVSVVVGNEGAGVSEALLAVSEGVTLTMVGPMESLNAAVAGSLLLYEAQRARLRAV